MVDFRYLAIKIDTKTIFVGDIVQIAIPVTLVILGHHIILFYFRTLSDTTFPFTKNLSRFQMREQESLLGGQSIWRTARSKSKGGERLLEMSS